MRNCCCPSTFDACALKKAVREAKEAAARACEAAKTAECAAADAQKAAECAEAAAEKAHCLVEEFLSSRGQGCCCQVPERCCKPCCD